MTKPKHAKAFNGRTEAREIAPSPANAGYPSTSWWATGDSWEAFSATAKDQEHRMRDSRLGRVNYPTLEG